MGKKRETKNDHYIAAGIESSKRFVKTSRDSRQIHTIDNIIKPTNNKKKR